MKKKSTQIFMKDLFFKILRKLLTPLLNRSIFFVIDSTIFFNRFSFSPVRVNIDDYYSFLNALALIL